MDIGIIVITHGQLADSLLSTLFSIVGKQEKIVSLSVPTEFTLESLCNDILQEIENLNTKYIVIFTDMLGGTPCNASLMVSRKLQNVRIISGVNLYMLITAIHLRESLNDSHSVDEYVDRIISEGTRSIADASKILSSKIK
ncbi:MAG: PTS sugar transporter subunit IIA [Endomicrobia bacterium]|nr:PTS sugar transporter subunit IIA [Endomicrobiia bacterium]